jgi:hypothetical protein
MTSHPATDAPSAVEPADWRELAIRESDGLQIALVWSKSADRVKIAVFDQQLDEWLDIHVPNDEALEAFHHPFSYGTDHGPSATSPSRWLAAS